MKKISNVLVLIIGLLMCRHMFGQVDARMLRYPDVSETRITFVYAGDIWVAPKEGGVAQRLSSPKGTESFPRFSPDGKQIAFTGNYDGNPDVYVISTKGGTPYRVTHHPYRDRLVDWYPDGKSLLYASRMESHRRTFNRFYKTSPKGGMPEKLPLAHAEFGAVSPDGKTIAFIMMSQDFSTWKRYRGGWAPDIRLFDLEKKTSKNITANDANDTQPMWHGSTVYFLSDQGPKKRGNIWAYDTKTQKTRQVTFFDKFDARFPAIGPKDIVFEKGGRLYLMALDTEKIREVRIKVVTDKATLNPRVEKVANMIAGTGISPSGKRVVVEARGDIFTVPAEHGVTLNLTRTPGIAERYPAWSSDGLWLAYFSDRSGNYELIVRPADGPGKETTLTSLGNGFRYRPQWSPDSKKLLFIDKTTAVRLYHRDSKKIEIIDTLPERTPFRLEDFRASWSPDSRWIAYSKGVENNNDAVSLYDTKAGKSHQVTSGYYSEWGPVFDPDGKYLYFFSKRNMKPIYSDIQPTWIYTNTTKIAAVTLRKDVKSPLAPRNDMEESKKDEKKKKGDKTDKKEGPEPVKIDLDGLGDRLVILPPGAGNYGSLSAVPGKVLFIRRPNTGASDRKSQIVYYDLKEREEKTILADAAGYTLTTDGKKMLVRKGRTYAIIDVKPNQKMKKPLNLGDLEMTVDPAAEWRQIFTETWRYGRDFFYDPGTHGIDWNEMRKRYGKLMDDAVTRRDVNYVIGELIGEIGAGHIFWYGGQIEKAKRRGAGLLGVDFELDKGTYRIKKIVDVGTQNLEFRSPLREPGVDVNEGDYILAVNGISMDTSKDPWAAFQGFAGKTVILTVNSQPSGTGARDVLVKTLTNDYELREKAWVEENRRKVDKATGGRIGYIFVPDTAFNGQTELVRQYRAQFRKKGLIIDERFNAGGQLGDRFIELMNRPFYNFIYFRDGKTRQIPDITNIGPKVMLMNGWSGSGGDALPYYFKKAGMGPLIGTRTWGGLVGPSYGLPLIDGGMVSIPPGRLYGTDGEWIIENIGAVPDIKVVNDPGQMAKGHDPQLERAIEVVLKMLKKNPPPPIPKHPKNN